MKKIDKISSIWLIISIIIVFIMIWLNNIYQKKVCSRDKKQFSKIKAQLANQT
jgi:hypothetical protein